MQKLQKSAKVMAKNQEKYRTLDIGRFQIRDSLEHIASSLDSLVNDLCQDSTFAFPLLNQFELLKDMPTRKRQVAIKLLKRKGVYPYEHFKSYKSL